MEEGIADQVWTMAEIVGALALILRRLGFNFFRETSQAKMKTFARRWVGAGICGISILIGLFLYLSGIPLISLPKYNTFPHGEMLSFTIHSSLIALLTAGFLGLCLMFMPSKKRIPPIIYREPKV